jgi:hypothetical protein
LPYIITTSTPDDVVPHESGVRFAIDRTAVATLDEARDVANAANDDACERIHAEREAYEGLADFESAAATIDDLPAEGGTIGPLPDGTVIEVRHVEPETIARYADVPFTDLDAVIAAYNNR